MRRILPASPGIMQACIRWSFDSLRGKLAGTSAVPCLVVTFIAGRVPSGSATLAVSPVSTLSTGAQSWW